MLTIEMLPAEYGDCIWIEYGSCQKVHRVLIDGGTKPTGKLLYDRIMALPVAQRRFDLFVITHIDADHLDGAVSLICNPPEGLRFDQVWFNAYKHLSAVGILGAKVGEYLAAMLDQLEKLQPGIWNGAFGGNAVMIPDSGELPRTSLEGGLQITVIGPTKFRLGRLRKQWEAVMKDLSGDTEAALEALRQDRRFKKGWLGQLNVEALAKSDFIEDHAAANGSSIALLIEFEGLRCLLAADCIPSDLTAALARLPNAQEQGRVDLTACKVPHHGSRFNNSNELYQKISSGLFLVSTNGARFQHPDPEGIARILYNKPSRATLLFNYLSDFNRIWNSESLQNDYAYQIRFPAEQPGIKVEL